MTHTIPRRRSQLALTPRQQAVLNALQNPTFTRKQAAASLGISYQTIHQHVRNILDRLNVPTLEAAFQLISPSDSVHSLAPSSPCQK